MTATVSHLRDTQRKKELWESLGAKFGLTEHGELSLSFHGQLIFDSRSKRDCRDFVNDNHRDLHALVLADGNDHAISRFESIMADGRFMTREHE